MKDQKFKGRIWECLRKGLRHYYVTFEGKANGAVWIYDGDNCIAVFKVVKREGLYETFRQTYERIS